jgi:hypothetical protein
VPLDRVLMLLGYGSIEVNERHYSSLARVRQELLEADVRSAWREPIPQTKGTPEGNENQYTVNELKLQRSLSRLNNVTDFLAGIEGFQFTRSRLAIRKARRAMKL